MNPITMFFTVLLAGAGGFFYTQQDPAVAIFFFALAVIVFFSLKMANAWEKFVILRAGKLQSVKGPGLFLIIPVLDNIAVVIDERIQTTAFNAEQALTKDTVPVNVDAIIFWRVDNAERAALTITNYRQAIERVAQSTRRETIGASMLASLVRPSGGRRAFARYHRGQDRRVGHLRDSRLKSGTSRSPRRCRTQCRARRKPSARSRRASS